MLSNLSGAVLALYEPAGQTPQELGCGGFDPSVDSQNCQGAFQPIKQMVCSARGCQCLLDHFRPQTETHP